MNWKEIYRYLGYRGREPGPEIQRAVRDTALRTEAACTPRWAWKRVPVSALPGGLSLGGWELKSLELAAHLTGCEEAFLMAATLGSGVDLLLRRLEKQDMSRAVIAQAAAAALIEEFCDRVEEELALQAPGLFLRPRFSPGYGDFDIACQREFLQRLDTARRIGLSMTDTCMLIPSKSVTAVIGLAADAGGCHRGKCSRCGNTGCPFRQEDIPPMKG